MAGWAVLGVAIERFAYRPLRNAPRIAPLISALGVSFFIAYSMQLMFGAQQRDYNVFAIDNGKLFLKGLNIPCNVRLPLLRIIIIVSAFVADGLLWLMVTRTRTGKAMRATSLRPRGGRDDGHRHRPRDRLHVHPRLGARRRRGRDVLAPRAAPPSMGFLAASRASPRR